MMDESTIDVYEEIKSNNTNERKEAKPGGEVFCIDKSREQQANYDGGNSALSKKRLSCIIIALCSVCVLIAAGVPGSVYILGKTPEDFPKNITNTTEMTNSTVSVTIDRLVPDTYPEDLHFLIGNKPCNIKKTITLEKTGQQLQIFHGDQLWYNTETTLYIYNLPFLNLTHMLHLTDNKDERVNLVHPMVSGKIIIAFKKKGLIVVDSDGYFLSLIYSKPKQEIIDLKEYNGSLYALPLKVSELLVFELVKGKEWTMVQKLVLEIKPMFFQHFFIIDNTVYISTMIRNPKIISYELDTQQKIRSYKMPTKSQRKRNYIPTFLPYLRNVALNGMMFVREQHGLYVIKKSRKWKSIELPASKTRLNLMMDTYFKATVSANDKSLLILRNSVFKQSNLILCQF